jgi:hypothetical protein
MLGQKRWLLLALVIIVIFIRNSAGEVPAQLEINYIDVAPQMVIPIPNQIWASNTNNTNAFDLDDFFIDDDENISYTASFVENISVDINDTTHEVSFYPEHDFSGIRTMFFTASDGQLSSTSNMVTLNVTPDTSPPKWSNPSLQPVNVTQNSIVTLAAMWKDNINLQRFMASVNQNGQWINQTDVEFSGIENDSQYSIQISAPGGQTVFWFITAFDSSGNQNSTSIQNFTVQALPLPPSSVPQTESTPQTPAEKAIAMQIRHTFAIDPEKGFIIQMLKGDNKTISFKITNTGNIQSPFNIEINGLEGFNIQLSKNNFTLPAGSSAIISVAFNAKGPMLPDIYYGVIKIKSGDTIKSVPITIELNELYTVLGVNLTVTKDQTILPGSLVSANIQLTNLKDIQPAGIYMYYAITDFNGNVLNSSTEQFELDTKAISFKKSLTLPINTDLGTYIFLTKAITNGSIVVGSDSFDVGENKSFAAVIIDNIWMLTIFITICAVIIMALIEYRNRRRMKLLNLYMMINELKSCIRENNYEEAIKVFVRIKGYYNEPIAASLLDNKKELVEEIKKFADKLDTQLEKSNIMLMHEEKKIEDKPADNKIETKEITSPIITSAPNENKKKVKKIKTKPNKKHTKHGKKRK